MHAMIVVAHPAAQTKADGGGVDEGAIAHALDDAFDRYRQANGATVLVHDGHTAPTSRVFTASVCDDAAVNAHRNLWGAAHKGTPMHEASLVMELIERCEELAGDRPVTMVRVKRSIAIDEDELREVFRACCDGTALASARLEVIIGPVDLECTCGFRGELGAGDVDHYLSICPTCGVVTERSGRVDLELIALRIAERFEDRGD
jgi:Zn finger protein HypA/HybF involved in hydrogenase expression